MSDRKTPAIDAKAAAFWRSYAAREAHVDEIFDTMAKVTQEVLRRIEQSLFSGSQYTGGPPSESQIKDVVRVGKLISEMAAVKLRVDREARAKAGRLTMDEKIEQVRKFVGSLPDTYRAELLAKISEK